MNAIVDAIRGDQTLLLTGLMELGQWSKNDSSLNIYEPGENGSNLTH